MFNPTLATQLHINGSSYSFSEHPAVRELVWGQEGRRGVVYRIEDNRDGEAFALKVFRPAHRRLELIDAAAALTGYSKLPGMRVAEQIVLTRADFDVLIDKYEDLEYAMVMPWIEGATWFDHLNEKRSLTLKESRLLAIHLARILSRLESKGLAHCDLSSANVIIASSLTELDLVDVEDFFGPEMPEPHSLPAGSQGYQHETSSNGGQWNALGDRFAGALLISEMLGWAHPAVRTRCYSESYFDPQEMQQNTTLFRVLRGVLRIHDNRLAKLFEQAWRSSKLEDCPSLKTWYDLLQNLPLDEPVATWQAVESSFYESKPQREWPRIKVPRLLRHPDRLLAAMIVVVTTLYLLGTFINTVLN